MSAPHVCDPTFALEARSEAAEHEVAALRAQLQAAAKREHATAQDAGDALVQLEHAEAQARAFGAPMTAQCIMAGIHRLRSIRQRHTEAR